jgi:lipoprotein-anchoring transpeptidase ErfK/SrfK
VCGSILASSLCAGAAEIAKDGQSIHYVIRPGDSLSGLAKKHGVTVGFIKQVNSLSSDKLMVGKSLIIPQSKLSVLVDKSDNKLYLNEDGKLLKTYIVSTGADNSTPVGVFKVTDKLEDPTWYKTGAVIPPGSKENQLGTRWMGITAKGYGIHGTTEPEKLGQSVSAGCVRMKNEEVEELFSLIPSGTEITIQD